MASALSGHSGGKSDNGKDWVAVHRNTKEDSSLLRQQPKQKSFLHRQQLQIQIPANPSHQQQLLLPADVSVQQRQPGQPQQPRDERLDSSENLSDIISELRDIESEKAGDQSADDQSDDELNKTPDEGEQELTWVKDAGLENIASRFEEGKEITDDIIQKETTTLTRKQAQAVKKRVNTLNNTLRKKQKKQEKADIRAVFSGGDQQSDPVKVRQSTKTNSDDRRRNGMFTIPPGGGDNISLGSHASSQPGAGGSSVHSGTQRRESKKVTIVRLPSRGEYSMHGQGGGGGPGGQSGIETISIQQKELPSSPDIYTTMYRPRTLVDDDLTVSYKADDSIVTDDMVDMASHVMKRPESSPVKSKRVGLPNFILEQETLGVTKVSDLSRKDLQKVRSLALIELTALYDVYEITYTRRKGKKKYREHGVFGVPLQTLCDQDSKKRPNVKVPIFYQELVSHLMKCGVEEEGILRVPGSATRIKQLRSEIDERFSSGRFSWEDVQINDAASMLKQLIRELPVPLLTFEYFEAFAEVETIPDDTFKQQLQALNLLVLMLPEVHRNTLQVLLGFLRSVVDNSENKMTINNVAMIMAPNLFLLPANRKGSSPVLDITYAARKSNIVRMLIKYQDILWTVTLYDYSCLTERSRKVPSFILSQVRSQYETDLIRKNKDKSNFMKFLGRKEKSEPVKKPTILNEVDFNSGIIRVAAPHMLKDSTAVQLDAITTAYDIVARFHYTTSTANTNQQKHLTNGRNEDIPGQDPFFTKTHLHEEGGNIENRRLDHNTKMLALYKVNPNALWVIRTSSPD